MAVHPVPTRYVRTQNGLTVHRAECSVLERTKYAHEWQWAEGKDPDQIIEETEAVGLHYHWCSRCFPYIPDIGGYA